MNAALHVRPAPSPPIPFIATGGTLVVAGGLVAAVNSAAPFAHGSWLAAYLVLVGGVAQIALGVGAAALAPQRRSARLARCARWRGPHRVSASDRCACVQRVGGQHSG